MQGKAREPRHTPGRQSAAARPAVLKRDALGAVRLEPGATVITRDFAAVAPWLRWLAAVLARREARALERLAPCDGFPRLLALQRRHLERTYLPGQPLYLAQFAPREFFRSALRCLRLMHARRIVHNDLAKEANWICGPGDRAGIVDFQIAGIFERRGRIFRRLAREDLRHLLKHKAHYAPELLSARQKAILARPSCAARMWRRFFKPVYRLITRSLLGWRERDGAAERGV